MSYLREHKNKYVYTGYIATNINEDSLVDPLTFSLKQNYSNPFNPATTIQYKNPKLNFVSLKVYDILGIEIVKLVNEEKSAGIYEVELDAISLPSGIYFYKLQNPNFTQTKEIILLK